MKILFDYDNIVADRSDAYTIDDCVFTIHKAGVYCFRGPLNDGQIIVDAGSEDLVFIELDDVDIHCDDSAPIWIKNADKVEIKLKKNTENKLSDGAVYNLLGAEEKTPNACIYARTDLKIKGKEGSLIIEAHYKNGINTCDDLKIKSGEITITAPASAIRGKDSVEIKNGMLTLTGGKHGIYSRGLVHFKGGLVKISSDKYGIFGFEGIKAEKTAGIIIEKSLSAFASQGTIDERLLQGMIPGKDIEQAEVLADSADMEEE